MSSGVRIAKRDSAAAAGHAERVENHPPPEPWPEERRWRSLRFYTGVRAALGLLVLTVAVFGPEQPPWEALRSAAFQAGTALYLLLCAAAAVLIGQRWPGFALQASAQLGTDIAAVVLLTHVGGISAGFGTLILAPAAVAGLLLDRRLAVLFAAVAALALLGEQVYSQLSLDRSPAYIQAGILGAMSFGAVLGAYALARRVRESEELAAQRGADLVNLSQLNELVLQTMQSGIVVVNRDGRVRLMNPETEQMLLVSGQMGVGEPLRALSNDLAQRLEQWQRDPDSAGITGFTAPDGSTELSAQFVALGPEGRLGTLISLEDQGVVKRRMQDMKLGALGRLSAGIAHEIRNPLGAMRQASQLLAESDHLGDGDRRLTEIIDSHGQRLNTIVENILELSRQPAAQPEALDLAEWLPTYVEFWAGEHLDDPRAVAVHVEQAPLTAYMDAGHLRQILDNLLSNARDHGRPDDGGPAITVTAGMLAGSRRAYLDVRDNGPGLDPDGAARAFEPFYTTGRQGTGLGLFIARELCEFNGASLNHVSDDEPGARFRISFADPRRWRG